MLIDYIYKITADDMEMLFRTEFSETGTNNYNTELEIVTWWRDLLRDCKGNCLEPFLILNGLLKY